MTPLRLQHFRLSLITTLLQASALHLAASALRLFSRPEPLPTALLPMTSAHLGTPLLLLSLTVAAAWPGSLLRRAVRTGLTFALLTLTWPGKHLVIFLRDLFGPLPWTTPWAGLLLSTALVAVLTVVLTRPRTRHLRETDARLRDLAAHLNGWKSRGRAGLPEHSRILVAPNGQTVTLHTAWGIEKANADGLGVKWLWPTEKQLQFLKARGTRLLWVALPENSQGHYRPKDWHLGQGQTLIGPPAVAAEHLHRLTGTLPSRTPAAAPRPHPTEGPPQPRAGGANARPGTRARGRKSPPTPHTGPLTPVEALASLAPRPAASEPAARSAAYTLPQEVDRPADPTRVLASPAEQMIRRLIHDAWRQLRDEMPWPVTVTGSHHVEIAHPDGPVQVRLWPHPDPAEPHHPDAALWNGFLVDLRREPCTAWIWSPLLRPDPALPPGDRHVRELRGHARLLREALEEGDPFRLLGVTPSSPPEEIRAAYRAQIRQLHPDHNSSPDAQVQATRLNAAYRWLTGPGA
ncbi:J domain-containing protein [Deinococcus ficus]|uniref:J domain-containing protein n=1 Tax=Deinococcus ficus TaxID=317577 RepID=A0A221T2N7_9DEIO|nr:J domain-containing protein [Deinococcus ficus]ASN83159.1 hypothetical protein DFI_18335 [Deinococcus ficus]